MIHQRRTLGGKPEIKLGQRMSLCSLQVEIGGDEDEGRAGRVRRAASTAIETAGNIARGILGRLRGRRAGGVTPRLASGRRG